MKSDYLGILSSIKQDIERYEISQINKPSLIVVTKSQSNEDIEKIIEAGNKCLGENYVDEAIKKIDFFKKRSLEWHFIGKIQSNKIKKISKYFDWVQTISSIKHAELLNQACEGLSKKMNVCIQVYIDREQSKSGILIEDLDDLIASTQEGNPAIKNFEMSIFDGKYPTSISSDYLEDLESSRKDDQKVAREKSN